MYQFNSQAAKEADNQGAFLKDSGKYKGRFTRAEKLVSKNKGTHGIGFTFEDDSKRSTRFDIWTLDAQNKPLMGFKALQAIWACLKLPSNLNLSERRGKVDRYDYDTKQAYTEEADVFPDLMNKPIGLVLRNTEYEKMRDGRLTGETGWRLELVVPFEASSEFTSSEIINRATKPEKLATILSQLEDRPLRKRTSAGAPAHEDPGYGTPAGEDDIPF